MPIRMIPSKFSRAWTRVSWSLALLWAVSGTVIRGLAVVGVVVLGRPLLRMDIIAAKVGPLLFLCLFFFAPSEGVSALGGLVGILSCSNGWTGGSHSVSIIGLDARGMCFGAASWVRRAVIDASIHERRTELVLAAGSPRASLGLGRCFC
jgi:hypothetical protein